MGSGHNHLELPMSGVCSMLLMLSLGRTLIGLWQGAPSDLTPSQGTVPQSSQDGHHIIAQTSK